MSPPSAFRPGFRFSVLDGALLLCGGALAGVACAWSGRLAVAAVFVLLHFFLFCNVFRIRRSFELLWAAALLLCVWLGDAMGDGSLWLAGVLPLAALGAALITWEANAASYHGVLWQRFNPDLPVLWSLRHRALHASSTSR